MGLADGAVVIFGLVGMHSCVQSELMSTRKKILSGTDRKAQRRDDEPTDVKGDVEEKE